MRFLSLDPSRGSTGLSRREGEKVMNRQHHERGDSSAPSRHHLGARVQQPARRAAIGVLATVAISLALPSGTASAHAPISAPATTSTAFCPLGTHDGPGSGCRGGSLSEGDRWKRAGRAQAESTKDAAGCAIEGVGKTLVPQRKGLPRPGERVKPQPLNPAQIFWGSQWEAFKCGVRERAVDAVNR